MALNDFFPVDPQHANANTRKYDVISGADAILPGELVVIDGGNPSYVAKAADGAGNIDVWFGVASTESTQTATADGEVYIYNDPQAVFRGKATDAANLIQTVKNTVVTLDVNADGVQTVDENDTVNGALKILDFDAVNGTVDVVISNSLHNYA